MPSHVTVTPHVGTRIASNTENMFREANNGHYAGQNCKINLFSQTLCDCGAFSCPWYGLCTAMYRSALTPIFVFLSPKPEYGCPTDVMVAGSRGKGLFSRGMIARDTFVIEYAGNRIGSKQKNELLAQGCDPNAVVELWDDPNGLPRALVISKRTIFPGEEITIHYGSDFMPSPCLCAKCIRGVTSSSAGGPVSNTEIPGLTMV
ncbi:hypothetical protein B0H13DRAFT_1867099 [Mycena leptocephala]|nr:hypothetical protein B0H13DRAFT_1867099 [Mycena leptocephala]